MAEQVTISEDEYNELKKDSKMLDALYYAGVDNWDGYGHALEMLNV